jgi:transcriptional regulator with XRE-family HTH domain
MEVNERIKQARSDAGLTQAELAKAVGVTLRTVQNWEAGTRRPFGHLTELAEATGKPVTFFFENGDGIAA